MGEEGSSLSGIRVIAAILILLNTCRWKRMAKSRSIDVVMMAKGRDAPETSEATEVTVTCQTIREEGVIRPNPISGRFAVGLMSIIVSRASQMVCDLWRAMVNVRLDVKGNLTSPENATLYSQVVR